MFRPHHTTIQHGLSVHGLEWEAAVVKLHYHDKTRCPWKNLVLQNHPLAEVECPGSEVVTQFLQGIVEEEWAPQESRCP